MADEILRDCAVIIRARWRLHGKDPRVNYGPLKQLFSFLDDPAAVGRKHLLALSKANLGEDEYLEALEKEWMQLWKRHAGTKELPDDDPFDLTDFDLRTHVKFLRANIDKDSV